METSKRARRRKLDTAKTDLEPPPVVTPEGRVSTARWESEGHEEKYRAVIDGKPKMNRSAKGGQVESALLRRRRSHSPTAPR